MIKKKSLSDKVLPCLDCGADIEFDKRPKLGQIISCQVCDTAFEVVSEDPIELAYVYDNEFEADEDDDFDDDDMDNFDDFDDDDEFDDFDDDDDFYDDDDDDDL